jgi:hypothetical protein
MVLFWVLGVAAVVRGVALVSTAAAWVVFGLALIVMALWPLLRRS